MDWARRLLVFAAVATFSTAPVLASSVSRPFRTDTFPDATPRRAVDDRLSIHAADNRGKCVPSPLDQRLQPTELRSRLRTAAEPPRQVTSSS